MHPIRVTHQYLLVMLCNAGINIILTRSMVVRKEPLNHVCTFFNVGEAMTPDAP